MKELLKVVVALACGAGLVRYASQRVIDQALAQAKNPAAMPEFDSHQVDLPEFHLDENPGWITSVNGIQASR